MSIILYVTVCSAFLGGALLIDQQREMRTLKRQLQQEPIQRNFRSYTA